MCLLDNKTNVSISIIIPTFNRRRELTECLESLAHQEGSPNFEVIVVDDGSEDGTFESIQSNSIRFPFPLKVIQQKRGGPGKARNTGARHAKGSTLLFIDSDCCAKTNWVKCLSGKIVCDDKIVGGPAITSLKASLFSMAVNYITHTWIGGWGDKWHAFGLIPGFRLRGMNFGIKREFFLSQNGFKQLWYGEDTEFSERLRAQGYSIKRSDEVIVIHCESRSVYDYMLEAFAKGWTVIKLLIHLLIPFRLLYIIPFLLFSSILFSLILAVVSIKSYFLFQVFIVVYCLLLIIYAIKGSWIYNHPELLVVIPIMGFLLHVCYAVGTACGLFLIGVPTKNALRPNKAINLKL